MVSCYKLRFNSFDQAHETPDDHGRQNDQRQDNDAKPDCDLGENAQDGAQRLSRFPGALRGAPWRGRCRCRRGRWGWRKALTYLTIPLYVLYCLGNQIEATAGVPQGSEARGANGGRPVACSNTGSPALSRNCRLARWSRSRQRDFQDTGLTSQNTRLCWYGIQPSRKGGGTCRRTTSVTALPHNT